ELRSALGLGERRQKRRELAGLKTLGREGKIGNDGRFAPACCAVVMHGDGGEFAACLGDDDTDGAAPLRIGEIHTARSEKRGETRRWLIVGQARPRRLDKAAPETGTVARDLDAPGCADGLRVGGIERGREIAPYRAHLPAA